MSNPLNCSSEAADSLQRSDNRYPYKTVVFSLWFDTHERASQLHDLAFGWVSAAYPGIDFVPQLDMVVEQDFGGLREVTFYARERHE